MSTTTSPASTQPSSPRRPACPHCRAPAPPTVALFGGTFDPPHRGHLILATAALARADQLWWLPVGTPAHRPVPRAPAPLRLAMCRALAGPRPGMAVCAADALGSSGYTVDLVARLQQAHPTTRFLLVVGADQAASLPDWHDSQRLLTMVDLLVAPRLGHRLDPHVLDALPTSAHLLDVPPTAASSTAVRAGRLDLLDGAVARLWSARPAFDREPHP